MTLTHHKTAQEEAQEWRGQKESLFCAQNPHDFEVQHGRYLENWYLEAGRDLGTS